MTAFFSRRIAREGYFLNVVRQERKIQDSDAEVKTLSNSVIEFPISSRADVRDILPYRFHARCNFSTLLSTSFTLSFFLFSKGIGRERSTGG